MLFIAVKNDSLSNLFLYSSFDQNSVNSKQRWALIFSHFLVHVLPQAGRSSRHWGSPSPSEKHSGCWPADKPPYPLGSLPWAAQKTLVTSTLDLDCNDLGSSSLVDLGSLQYPQPPCFHSDSQAGNTGSQKRSLHFRYQKPSFMHPSAFVSGTRVPAVRMLLLLLPNKVHVHSEGK